MAETIGSLVDKISITELRRWHTEEAMLNPRAPSDVRHECALRLAIIDEQREDLIAELDALWESLASGAHIPRVCRKLKMYNDRRLRDASSPPPTAQLAGRGRRHLAVVTPQRRFVRTSLGL